MIFFPSFVILLIGGGLSVEILIIKKKICAFVVMVAHLGVPIAGLLPSRPFIDCTDCKAAGKCSLFGR